MVRAFASKVVFVKLEEDLFEARVVDLGSEYHGNLEVVAGLNGEELVAILRGYALKSQLLISRLGAGCVDD